MARKKVVFRQRVGLYYWLKVYEKDGKLSIEVSNPSSKNSITLAQSEVHALHRVLGEWLTRPEEG